MRIKCDRCGWYHFNENDHLVDRDGPLPPVKSSWDPLVEIDDQTLAIFYQKQLEAIQRS